MLDDSAEVGGARLGEYYWYSEVMGEVGGEWLGAFFRIVVGGVVRVYGRL